MENEEWGEEIEKEEEKRLSKKAKRILHLTLKPTFEKVMEAQKKLRHLIEKLIEEGRALKPDERDEYFELLAYSTLGLGTATEVTVEVQSINDPSIVTNYSFGNVESFALMLMYLEDEYYDVEYSEFTEYYRRFHIRELWMLLLEHLLEVFPKAWKKSFEYSKETVLTPGVPIYDITDEVIWKRKR